MWKGSMVRPISSERSSQIPKSSPRHPSTTWHKEKKAGEGCKTPGGLWYGYIIHILKCPRATGQQHVCYYKGGILPLIPFGNLFILTEPMYRKLHRGMNCPGVCFRMAGSCLKAEMGEAGNVLGEAFWRGEIWVGEIALSLNLTGVWPLPSSWPQILFPGLFRFYSLLSLWGLLMEAKMSPPPPPPPIFHHYILRHCNAAC